MEIRNSTSETVSWFCFNHHDPLKIIALESGNLSENGIENSFNPPDNTDGFYTVRFTYRGGGTELASCTVSKTGSINLVKGQDENYQAVVSEFHRQ